MFSAVPTMDMYYWDMHLVCFFEESNLHHLEICYLDCLFIVTADSTFACSWCTPFIVWSREALFPVSSTFLPKNRMGRVTKSLPKFENPFSLNRFSSTVWIGLSSRPTTTLFSGGAKAYAPTQATRGTSKPKAYVPTLK